MTVMNGALLAFVGTHLRPEFFPIFIGTMGVVVCVIWLQMQRRYAGWVGRWESKLQEFEPLVKEEIDASRAALRLPGISASVALFSEEKKPRIAGWATRKCGCYLAGVYAFTWAALVVYILSAEMK
jgi:hypothetical protein